LQFKYTKHSIKTIPSQYEKNTGKIQQYNASGTVGIANEHVYLYTMKTRNKYHNT